MEHYKATPEQWDRLETGSLMQSSLAVYILELRARVEALEAAQPKQITQEELAKLLAQPARVVPLATASAGSLVETPDELEELLRLMNSGAGVCHSEGYEELHDAICRGVDLLERLTQQHLEPIDEEENDRRFKATMAAIDAATPEQIRAAAGLPERSSLVERVSCAIDGRINPDQWLHQDAARAAIREVAVWFSDRATPGTPQWIAAAELTDEVER